MKDYLIYVFMFILAGFSFWFGYQTGKIQKQQKEIPSLEQIQEWVGCDDIDGKYGIETKTKWQLALNNQYANLSERAVQ